MIRPVGLGLLILALCRCGADPKGQTLGSGDDADSGYDAAAAACTAPIGSGTTHATWPTASETWAAAGNPHILTADIEIARGLTLTIEPCADLKLAKGVHLNVEGSVVAEGTPARPITIDASNPTEPFGALSVFGPGTLRLAYVSVANGGADTANSYGAIEARGDQLAPAQEILRVDHVAVQGAVAFGVSLRAGAAFTADSSSLTISGAAKGPMRVNPRLLSNVPTGSYTGNGLDAIVVETEAYGDITLEDVTVHDRGVPYQIGGDKTAGTMVVGAALAAVKLTITPGVVLRFKKDPAAGLHLDRGSYPRAANAQLLAIGTVERPIVFTSAASPPAPGDWLGLSFGNQPAGTNQLAFAEIRYAGGPSFANGFHCQPNGALSANEDAAVTMYGQPSSEFVVNSTLSDSAGVGVNLAYSGGTVDFLASNTFTNLASCKQSTPRTAGGACPSSVSCP